MKETRLQRFMKRVNPTAGCWEWIGTLNKGGYGQFAFGHADKRSAHRCAWLLLRGKIPRGKCVLHRCDNRKCVNPRHLFIGTQIDNVKDMDAKGRRNTSARHSGESSPNSKLKSAQIIEIRKRWSRGEKQCVIAARFKIHNSVISRIVNGMVWRGV